MPSIFDKPEDMILIVYRGGDDMTGPVTPNPSVFNTDEENVILDEGHGGQRVEDTRRIQQRLKSAGYDPGPVDGLWGPKTCGAALHFQQKYFGNTRGGYLDYDFFTKLGFDTMTSDRFARQFGFSCGATSVPPKEEERSKDYPPGEGVTQADIKEIQKRLGLRQTGTFNQETCKALFRIQQNNGNMQKVLLSSTFEKVGYPGSEAKRLAGGFSASCSSFWMDLISKPKPKPVSPVEPKPEPDAPKPQKAGMSWLLWVFGGVAAAGILWTAMKKKKR